MQSLLELAGRSCPVDVLIREWLPLPLGHGLRHTLDRVLRRKGVECVDGIVYIDSWHLPLVPEWDVDYLHVWAPLRDNEHGCVNDQLELVASRQRRPRVIATAGAPCRLHPWLGYATIERHRDRHGNYITKFQRIDRSVSNPTRTPPPSFLIYSE